jgi:DNA invertase Pin-like site-specific DNA recombinase
MKESVRVISVRKHLDLNSDYGEMIAAVIFAIAKMFRINLIENTKRALAAAKARGVKLGKRPWKWTGEVKPLRERGMHVPEIAKRFGKSKHAVRNVLSGKTATYSESRY